ncbi:MAG: DEAD/DEAH box helicase [Motiliproteus sp.]
MLPATLAQEVKKQVQHYLEATFPLRDADAETALARFMGDMDNGLFKGPWLQLRRPFRPAADKGEQFFDLTIPFTPFRHQWESWQRLTSKNNRPKPTIVTTGTGSGKTECFLYPILDHCLRQHQAGEKQGIKAIVLYPMNALAADQAGRFAEEILKSEQLSSLVKVGDGERRVASIRVGLYTGRMQPNQEDRSGEEKGTYTEVQIISPDGPNGKPSYVAITNRQAMQGNPPDILLTNYKMLDYLLMRPKDQGIWQHNIKADCLRYLVLDELHTYDGAQGADVACLIRRLKLRLNMAVGDLCVVGTSATIAAGEDESQHDPINRLCGFAERLFEEPISNDAVILEDRLSIAEIVRTAVESPVLASADLCQPGMREEARTYCQRIAPLFSAPEFPLTETPDQWQGLDEQVCWSLAVGGWVRSQPLFHEILKATENGAVIWHQLLTDLSKRDFNFREAGDIDAREQVLMAFLALVSQAKELRSGRAFPLVPTQVQFWMRELRRIGMLVADTPVFNWLDQPIGEKRQLPIAHCTECGEVSWVALIDPNSRAQIQQTVQGFGLEDDVREIYQGWGFEGPASPGIVTISRWQQGDEPLVPSGQMALPTTRYHLAPNSLVMREGPGPCPLSGEATFPVKFEHHPETRNDGLKTSKRVCPHCLSEDTLMFIGSRAATVASVAMDELFGSTLNSDPKLLAFTDSVQDASHRAGFFSARTYRFTLRTALQHTIDEEGDAGLPLARAAEALLDYWSQPEAGRPGSLRETIATIIPPDIREYKPYLDYRNSASADEPSPQLREDIVRRLNWEVISEFGLMQTHGRTMESQCSATLGWDPAVITQLAGALKTRLPGISPSLAAIDEGLYELWIYGVLHRSRLRGGLYHAFMDDYATKNYWGKYPFGKAIAGREVYPSAGKYRPRLLVTESDRYHDYMLSASVGGGNIPWNLVWARRVLPVESIDDNTLIELFRLFLEEGETARLLIKLSEDGTKQFYGLNPRMARLYSNGVKMSSSSSGEMLFRPEWEMDHWLKSPSLGYRDHHGIYQREALNDREAYYQQRYRKGALRRVFAYEHTGLLTTEEREALEMEFNAGGHADDANVLTATSTLEMGIDIGDLSSTMLCSIPPTVASYLQRIGRAGRSTGTALVLSVINQRPHDLFFYARPEALLNGDIEPPGCWLDATAVLVRQYLAFCFDESVKQGVIAELPSSGKQLVDEMVVKQAGNIPTMLAWVTLNEASMQQTFLDRFVNDVLEDTRDRFMQETVTETLKDNILQAAQDFDNQRRLLVNAKKRLNDQKTKIDESDEQSLEEIEREQKILRARTSKLGQISALEVLTEHGLLPNYAFPERGVRFSGTTYNKHRGNGRSREDSKDHIQNFEIVRSGSTAIRELAPGNRFYTHSHVFEIQQLEVGSKNQPLLEDWSICGQCGFMATTDAVNDQNYAPLCPQCGYDIVAPSGLKDAGQSRPSLPFHRSQAISYMEYYDSLSADRREERESEPYQLITSFDNTIAQSAGAVGDDETPFGIEYRSAIRMREINTGYKGMLPTVDVGNDRKAPDGFSVCADCGVAAGPRERLSKVGHRRSCSGRRKTEAMQQQGQEGDAYLWQNAWLYRELRSEAVRLLLPEVEEADMDTLEAAIYLGMRLRFQGDPAHLLVRAQSVPDYTSGLTRHYLVLMDAVPGGTGFLKALFQETDEQNRAGQGVIEVMTLARNALETCECKRVHPSEEDTDGCYKCIRTYHLQHRSTNISRDRGIDLLDELLRGAENRETKESLDDIKIDSLFDSVLEKRFVARLREWVSRELKGAWQDALVNGKKGYRFVTTGDERSWELELQPLLGPSQGVSIPCQPDFMLRCTDSSVKDIAIFTDGFEPHVHPGEPTSRLTDDIRKRRAIVESGQYFVWSITWEDLEKEPQPFKYLHPSLVDKLLPKKWSQIRNSGHQVPALKDYSGNLWQQLQAFILAPDISSWRKIAEHISGIGLFLLAGRGIAGNKTDLSAALDLWQEGEKPLPLTGESAEPWVWNANSTISGDIFTYGAVESVTGMEFEGVSTWLRLDDDESARANISNYRPRWRQILAWFNTMQFATGFNVLTTTEFKEGLSPPPKFSSPGILSEEWQSLLGESIGSLEVFIKTLADAGCAVPLVEYYDDAVADDAFAEYAWVMSNKKIVFLIGDQISFSSRWVKAGFKVFSESDLKVQGIESIIKEVPQSGSSS